MRHLNNATLQEFHPQPTIDEVIAELHVAQLWSNRENGHAKDSFVISGLNFEPTVSVKSFKAQLNLYDIIFGKTQRNHAC